ncbi:polyprenyl synthetase family protein [Macrococcoides canis]|uniref:polyprenyl synthetase family protein n=1 Tax=Macrococcoides canis TaxID=1855823 RepID=UPI001B8D8D42|nr:farnesyl diphosphate synthase [Macrococcus canis]QUR95480.1 polyprenyl synthetase family protein [Macrococcus canis]UTH05977.1 polyprenyl synthetase family protein [Macrococcus canis]
MNKQFLQNIEDVIAGLYKAKDNRLLESMQYSLSAGGKRIRPLFVLTAIDSLGGNAEDGLHFGVALEMIHTYSLIHDDLPAMDDDDYRRGKLTNHKQFDEATAILAGDALLTDSFRMITDSQLDKDIKLSLISLLSEAAGSKGMVYGQMLDMAGEHQSLELDQMEEVHSYKTGELIRAAFVASGIIMKLTEEKIQLLDQIGRNVGLMFQIQDDILDVEGSFEEIGKPVGSDIANDKSTYVSLLGLEQSKALLKEKYNHTEKLVQALSPINNGLLQLIRFIIERNK